MAAASPPTIEGYSRLNAILATTDKNLPEIKFGAAGQTIQVRSPSEAAELLPRYTYDEVADTIFDIETQTLYTNIEGTFTSREGDEIKPGFRASVGLGNFEEFFTSPSLRGPLVRIVDLELCLSHHQRGEHLCPGAGDRDHVQSGRLSA